MSIQDFSHAPAKLLGFGVLPLCFLLLLIGACTRSHEVTTWNEWCVYEARPARAGFANQRISYNLPRIRADFIKHYNEILVEELVSNHFWDSTIHTNEAAEGLIKSHQLGLWITGNQLHFANTHLSHEEFEGDVERFKKFLSFRELEENKYRLNRFQICIYKTIDSLFESFVIHTRKESRTITLDFSHKSFFKKS